MTLTTHAVIGATTAVLVPSQPLLGFFLAFSSHFILDAFPHWHYPLTKVKEDGTDPLKSPRINQASIIDFLKIGLDGLLGLLLSVGLLIWLDYPLWLILIGAGGGMLPDALQFFYFIWKHEPLKSIQRFHMFFHTKYFLDNHHIIGVGSQILLIICAFLLLKNI